MWCVFLDGKTGKRSSKTKKRTTGLTKIGDGQNKDESDYGLTTWLLCWLFVLLVGRGKKERNETKLFGKTSFLKQFGIIIKEENILLNLSERAAGFAGGWWWCFLAVSSSFDEKRKRTKKEKLGKQTSKDTAARKLIRLSSQEGPSTLPSKHYHIKNDEI